MMEKKDTEQPRFLLSGKFCPQCEEPLVPADLEMFLRCPYCNYQFQNTPEVEAFILRPLLNRWAGSSFHRFMR